MARMPIITSRRQPEGHQRRHALGQLPRDARPLHRQRPGEGGDEGGVEGALAEQPAEQVGQLERDEEGIRHRPGAEPGGDQHVPREAEDAAGHGPAADGEDAFEHRRRLEQKPGECEAP